MGVLPEAHRDARAPVFPWDKGHSRRRCGRECYQCTEVGHDGDLWRGVYDAGSKGRVADCKNNEEKPLFGRVVKRKTSGGRSSIAKEGISE